jgi:UPF0271 protein
MSLSVDLNADLGEGAGHDDELLALVTSANIACGLHAGNVATMQRAIRAAAERGVAIGAIPGFEDRENFGRREMAIGDEEVFRAGGVSARRVSRGGAFVRRAGRAREAARRALQYGGARRGDR